MPAVSVEQAETALSGGSSDPPRAELWHSTLRFGAPVFVAWGLLVVLFWPGLLSPDTISQWPQLADKSLDQWHPYTFALVLGVLRWIWDSPTLPLALQVVAAGLVTGRSCTWLARTTSHRWIPWAASLAVALSPSTAIVGATLWKDTTYSVAVVGLGLVGWRVVATGGSWLSSRRNLAWFVLTASAVSLLRHNGWPIVAVLVVAYLFAYTDLRRRVVAVGAIVLAIVLFVNVPLARALEVTGSVHDELILTQRIAMHLNRGAELDPADRAVLEEILPTDALWPYDCKSSQATWSGAYGVDLDDLEGKGDELRSILVELALDDPGGELAHLRCSTAIIWRVFDGFPPYLTEWGLLGDLPLYRGLGLAGTPDPDPPSPRAATWVMRGVDDYPSWLIRPAAYLWALVFAGAVAIARIRNWRASLIPLPFIAQSIAIAPLTLVQDIRFQMAVIMGALLFVPALLLLDDPSTDEAQPDDADEARDLPPVPEDAAR